MVADRGATVNPPVVALPCASRRSAMVPRRSPLAAGARAAGRQAAERPARAWVSLSIASRRARGSNWQAMSSIPAATPRSDAAAARPASVPPRFPAPERPAPRRVRRRVPLQPILRREAVRPRGSAAQASWAQASSAVRRRADRRAPCRPQAPGSPARQAARYCRRRTLSPVARRAPDVRRGRRGGDGRGGGCLRRLRAGWRVDPSDVPFRARRPRWRAARRPR